MDDKIYLGLKHRDYNYTWTVDAEIINHFSIDGKVGASGQHQKSCVSIDGYIPTSVKFIFPSMEKKDSFVSLTDKIHFSIDGNFCIHFPFL